MAEYQFNYDKITCCSDCPLLNEEFCCCQLEDDNRRWRELTIRAEGKRPGWCKLKEVMQDG